jgi:hypothetical protein
VEFLEQPGFDLQKTLDELRFAIDAGRGGQRCGFGQGRLLGD